MKKVAMILSLIFFSIFLVSCDGANSEDVENDDQVYAIYELAVSNANYDGTYEEWLESVKGPKGDTGDDGKEIYLQVSDGYIQWQYLGDTEWSNLVDLVSLTGSDGQEVLFQVSNDFIQWKYTDSLTWTNLIALDYITGADGREISFQVSDSHIQWQYNGEIDWRNLIELEIITGADGINGIDGLDGVDGREIMLQIDGDMLQWKYVGDDSWIDLIIYNNINDGYYLTDEEINHILTNYTQDIKNLFPTIDLDTLTDSVYENTCDSVEYEVCNNIDNYPMIFAEGYEKFVDKQKAIDLLGYAMKSISDLMGTYESEPIVPNNYLSGTDALATVEGRNNTSILFEGNLDGSVPIDIPIDLQFTYQLLIYKSIEDNKVYVEGDISFG
jgi:hypothetical protein